MSQTSSEIPRAPGANYKVIFDSALQTYKKKTGKNLASSPLFHRLEACGSPEDVVGILRGQIPGFGQSSRGHDDDRLTKWLDPTVRVINAFSMTIGGAVALVSLTQDCPTHRESAC
jgi:hypothetical protein